MTIGERIKFLRKKNAMTQTDIAKKLNIATQTVFKYEKNIVTSIPMENIQKLSEIFGVTPAYIMGWETETDSNLKLHSPTVTEDYVTFPVIGEIAAGYESIAVEDWSGEKVDIPTSYLKGREIDDFFVLGVKGNSMFPEYREGDKVLILKQSTLNYSGQVGAIIYNDDYATLKRVEYKDGEDWMNLVPINPAVETQRIEGVDLERCKVLGIPRLLIRDIKN